MDGIVVGRRDWHPVYVGTEPASEQRREAQRALRHQTCSLQRGIIAVEEAQVDFRLIQRSGLGYWQVVLVV